MSPPTVYQLFPIKYSTYNTHIHGYDYVAGGPLCELQIE